MATVETQEFEKFINKVKGRMDEKNDNDVLAKKMARKINSGFKSQIAVLDGKLPDLEDAVDEAKDAYTEAKFPTEFSDQNSYFENLKSAKADLNKAENALEDVKSTIALRKEQHKEIIG